MHFASCSLKAFGQFKDVQFDELSERIVVLLGPNEAGKSTFFEFLQTILYGIYPTNPERHKYTPREGGALEGSARIVLSAGEVLDVSRRLAHVPQGYLSDGTDTDLRNQAVPAANFISNKVFDAIYALDLHDMTGLEGRAWNEVQDRLLGGMNLDFLRSARTVIEELEREANDLWRPDRRGRPLDRRLRERREALSERLGEAQRRETELKELAAEIKAGEKRLAELRNELPKLQKEARRIDRIGPIALRWRKIQALREEAGNVDSYRHVPENPGAILREWHGRDDEYAQRLKDIDKELEQSEIEQMAVHEEDETIVRHADEIRGWSKRAGAHETNLAALRKAGTSLAELRLRINDVTKSLAAPGEERSLIARVRDWDPDPLKEAVDELEDFADGLTTLKSHDAELRQAIERSRPYVPAVTIAIGAVFAAVGVLQAIPAIWMAGGGLGLAGIVWLAFVVARTNSLRSERDRLQVDKADAKYRSMVADLEARFTKLGVHLDRTERPNSELVSALVELKGYLNRRRELVSRARALTGMLDADRVAIHPLAKACGKTPDLDVISTVNQMQDALEEAAEKVRRAESARQRLFRLKHDREHLIADRQALLDQIVQVEAALSELGAGDVSAGLKSLERRRQAKLRADHDDSTLDKDHPGWRDLQDSLETLTEADWQSFTEGARQDREEELDRLRQEVNFESVRTAKKRNELAMLLKNESPDEVESRIESIDEQLRQARRKRDRLILMANVIRRADQLFRYKHQPDVVKKASEYLEKITAGRYHRMILEEEEQQLMVFERGSAFPIQVDESMSQGTRDQVYLSIRFALMDHLDANQERLPACLDEVFVNWDENRRQLGYEILKDLAKRRQVFVFTCHPWMADELESVVTAQRIEL